MASKPITLPLPLGEPVERPSKRMPAFYSKAFEAKVAMTAPGQAGFAGEGPPGTICGGCKRFMSKGAYAGASRDDWPKPGPCGKFTDITRNKGANIPARTPSCKHYKGKHDK
jgi:hypothetical protein